MKGSNILVSILVPTYNRVKYLKECLDSIIEQEWFVLKELELIVSDNSEWNETKEFMDNYIKDHNDWNIKYNKNERNLWMVWNWNKLLELKKWEYYIFLSDDDKFYDKDSLKLLLEWLNKYQLDACYWKYRVIDWMWNDKWDFEPHKKIWDNKIYYDSFKEQQIKWHSISFWWILYKNYNFKYDYKSKRFADYHMNLQYLYHNKRIALINIYTFYYRVHDLNDSNTIPKWFWLRFLFYRHIYFWTYKYFFEEIIIWVRNRFRKLLKFFKRKHY